MQILSEDGLNQLYNEIFSKISATEPFARNTAIQVFSFLICIQEALSPMAFLAAIARTFKPSS